MDTTEKIQRIIADRIKARRKALNLSQADLAEMLQNQGVKIHQSAITKIESGERKLEIGLAMQIADALDMSWDTFHVQEKSTSDSMLLKQAAEASSSLSTTTLEITGRLEEWSFLADFDLANLSQGIYERIRSGTIPKVGAYRDIADTSFRATNLLNAITEVIAENIEELEDLSRALRMQVDQVRDNASS